MAHYVDSLPYDQILATATGISTDIDFRLVSDAEMAAALARRGQAGPAERDIYASYVNEAFLTALEKHGEQIVFQFSLGAEPLPFETGSRLSQRTIGQLAEMIARHPGLRFQCFLASRHANQSLCTLARELPNFSLAGYWWHNFFPDAIRQVMAERLDMLPVNKQVGFFSDAYCVEWTYGKALLVRKQLARVLAEKVESGTIHAGRRAGDRPGDPLRDAADAAGHGPADRCVDPMKLPLPSGEGLGESGPHPNPLSEGEGTCRTAEGDCPTIAGLLVFEELSHILV